MMSAASRIVRGLVGLVALIVLAVGVPAFLALTVGNPWPGRDALQLRDDRAILLGVLAALAWLVWARFLVSVGSELVVQVRQLRVERSRHGADRADVDLAAPPSAPAGGGFGLLASRLVALALTLIPASQVVPSSPGPLPFRPGPAAAAAAPASATALVPAAPRPAPGTSPLVEVRGGDSLFRIAERHLGTRARWREILELNAERVQADGARLTTPSALRSGWTLVLPADAVVLEPGVAGAPGSAVVPREQSPTSPAIRSHVVESGDSYWRIAAAALRAELGREPSAGEIATETDALIARNTVRLGHADPAMLYPGEVVELSRAPAVEVDARAATHVVGPGDSYWRIATVHLAQALGREPTAAEVSAATGDLIALNAPLFGYADPALLHPGDEVIVPGGWPAPAAPDASGPGGPAPAPPRAAPAVAVDAPAAPAPTPAAPAATVPDAAPSSVPADPAADPAASAPDDPSSSAPADPAANPAAPADDPSAAPAAAASAAPDGTATSATGEPMTVDPPAAAGPTRGPARGDVVPVTGPPDTTEPDYGDLLGTGDPTGRDLRAPLGLGAAVLVAAGTVATLDARRRAALRRAAARSRLDAAAANPLELQLRALDGPARLLRLDLVLRALAAGLRGEQCQPLVVIVHRDGTVRVLLSAAGEPGEPWFADGDGWWVLPGSLADDELVVRGRSSGLPCPAIVHLGDADGADVYLDLEAVGSLTIGGPPAVAASIVDAVALGLALSPFSLDATLTLVGVDERIAEARDGLEIGADVEQATTVARSMLGTIGAATAMGASTFALRARSTVERWEPAIVVLGSGIDAGDDLRELAGTGGRGVGLVTTTTMPTGACLRPGDGGWTLEPWGLTITPVGIAPDDVAAVVDVLDEGERDLLLPPPAGDVPPVDAAAYEDPDWELLVRVLGPVRVHDGAGTDVRFDRNKAQELVCWLALHRERATRTAARTALWEAGVRDATFANVVSDARRNMARLMAPPEGQEWIGRTLTESLVLHPLVRTDADLLAERVAAARAQPADAAIELLRPALALVTDLPFAGTGYVWPDVEGIATELLLLATTAAQELAEHCLAGGDIEGVFWATGQGLRVLPGHEELVALRMRAHARAGDLAGVRAEWGSYERALASDPWCEAEPAAKLVSLRRDLLGAAVDRR